VDRPRDVSHELDPKSQLQLMRVLYTAGDAGHGIAGICLMARGEGGIIIMYIANSA